VENPYCVILDHKWRSVVVAVRGTLSLEDCITDALAESVSLEDLGQRHGFDGKGEYCHAGMLASSEWIASDLAKRKTLEKAFSLHPDYSLRITGHSLGAGCAFLLSLMLKKQYPGLRCLPYSPPGGLVSMKTARASADYTTSFILGSDIVPRLSIESMEHLRNETLEIISRLKVRERSGRAQTKSRASAEVGIRGFVRASAKEAPANERTNEEPAVVWADPPPPPPLR
jgi:sn1-specific diacylglycerol lipase